MKRLVVPLCLGLLLVLAGVAQSAAPPKKPRENKAAGKGTPAERFERFVAKVKEDLPKDKYFDTRFKILKITHEVHAGGSSTAVLRVEFVQNNKTAPWAFAFRGNYAFKDDRWTLKDCDVDLVNRNDIPENLRSFAENVRMGCRTHFENSLLIVQSGNY